ncbi:MULTISPECIES: STAS domain-containing protein [unclassified Micromonospora]|uniref:STAS domain-containing protein n=1 Tax=unclassified Micromonospora TaxID=2617518 RepID=UPI0022B6A6FE|nr:MULTISPECIES: STAS domain-containing protein [unclassified Micromonospora]MCZ7422912.1 STAS domain-containing protein [Verrucosispora sp. WMMA2121]WBB90643.1 STAS domain-containing protein [Verrucosispora sp. WMMC514]
MTAPRRPECSVPLVEVSITEFDLSCLPETGAVLDQLLALRPGQVVIDLAGCRHIDAAAIGLLLDVHRRMVRAGGVLAVRNPNPRITRILQTARLDQILPVHTDAGAAPAPVAEAITAAPGVPPADGAPAPGGTVPRAAAYGRAAVTVRT